MSLPPSIEPSLRSLERGHRFAELARRWVAAAIVFAVIGWLAESLLPRPTPGWIWLSVVIAWTTIAVISWRRTLVPIAVLDRRLGLGDRLQTWFEAGRAGHSPAMREWLGRELAAKLATLPPLVAQRSVRRSLRPLRVLLPLLIAMFLLRAFEPDRALDLDEPVARAKSGDTDDSDGADGSDASQPSEDAQPAPEPTPTPRSPEPQPEPERPPAAAPPVEPSPLIEPSAWQDDFVVPQFIGEGPSTTTEAHVADVDEAAPRVEPNRRQTAGATAVDELPEPEQRREFQRAEERAMRSRHVAEHERRWVQRYFELLLERRR